MQIARDKDGYLVDLSEWNEDVAIWLASNEGIVLDDTYWHLIRFVRNYYDRTNVAPEMRPLVKLVREHVDPELGTSIALMKLFPQGPAKQLAKIAGLPRPKNCL